MKQASWDELFAPRQESPAYSPEVPEEPQGWHRLFWWEDLLTLGLLSVVFLAMVGSIDAAEWVDDMPSLYPITFFGLAMAMLLARVRQHERYIHLLSLPVGAAATLASVLTVVPGPDPWERLQTLAQRMHAWFGVAFGGGVSDDSLPFVVLLVAVCWLAAYLSSWAIFRWQNAWLGLLPGGAALLTNISYLPGEFSFAFVVFLFCGLLLVARLHVMERAKVWRKESTPYPWLISLSVLHATFWLALLVVLAAWLLPQANEAKALESMWRQATAPVTERVEGFGRLFASVEGKTATISLRSSDGELSFLGAISLPDRLALEVRTEPPDQPLYLRERAFDIYTATGWRQQHDDSSRLGPYEITDVDREIGPRGTITIRVTATGRTGDAIFTVGQPRRVDRVVTLRLGTALADVTGVEAEGGLGPGEQYESAGSISLASVEALRAAGVDYPAWVLDRYLQLPADFPARVSSLARELAGSHPTAYDQAAAIEAYLRTIPFDFDVPEIPDGRDAVDYFLFDIQRGYSDYHASAMVVLLRSLGVPARLASGYVLDESQREGESGRYLVTERSAFAWPEVYFPGRGWVEFNPTPGLPVIARRGFDATAPLAFGGGVVTIVELRLEDLLALFPEGTGDVTAVASLESSNGRNWWPLIAFVAGIAAALVVVAGGLRYAWSHGIARFVLRVTSLVVSGRYAWAGGLEHPARRWAQTLWLASCARLDPTPNQTPREYARFLREKVPGLDEVDLLADAYVRYRFGARGLAEAEQDRLDRAWRIVRDRLLRQVLRPSSSLECEPR